MYTGSCLRRSRSSQSDIVIRAACSEMTSKPCLCPPAAGAVAQVPRTSCRVSLSLSLSPAWLSVDLLTSCARMCTEIVGSRSRCNVCFIASPETVITTEQFSAPVAAAPPAPDPLKDAPSPAAPKVEEAGIPHHHDTAANGHARPHDKELPEGPEAKRRKTRSVSQAHDMRDA
jgi:hypothetical protein